MNTYFLNFLLASVSVKKYVNILCKEQCSGLLREWVSGSKISKFLIFSGQNLSQNFNHAQASRAQGFEIGGSGFQPSGPWPASEGFPRCMALDIWSTNYIVDNIELDRARGRSSSSPVLLGESRLQRTHSTGEEDTNDWEYTKVGVCPSLRIRVYIFPARISS